MNNFNPITAEQQAEAQRRLEEAGESISMSDRNGMELTVVLMTHLHLFRLCSAEDAEFDYELYRNHPIQSADHNSMPLFMDARNVRRQLGDEDDTEATCVDIEALKVMNDQLYRLFLILFLSLKAHG